MECGIACCAVQHTSIATLTDIINNLTGISIYNYGLKCLIRRPKIVIKIFFDFDQSNLVIKFL